ncbi:LppA family lipoprotein [Nocardia sp. NPDC050378]|uniref:LppA family lipoprotein n=1 Tax=Nocardia sp. NPDC050378 TaxID=3155400 RepID=UPI0033DD7DD7
MTGPEETAAALERLRQRPSMEQEFTAMRSITMEIAAVAAELLPGITFEWSKSDHLSTEQCFKPYDQTGAVMIGLESYRSAPSVEVPEHVWRQFTQRVQDIAGRIGALATETPENGVFYNAADGTKVSMSRHSGISIDTQVGCRLSAAQLDSRPNPTGPEETVDAQQRLLERRSLESEFTDMRAAVEEIGSAASSFTPRPTFEWGFAESYRPKSCGIPYDRTEGTVLILEDYQVVSHATIADEGWQQVTDRARDVAARFGATPPVVSEMPGNYTQTFVNSEDGARISVRNDQRTITISAQTGCRLADDPRLHRSAVQTPAGRVPYPTLAPLPTS